MDAYAKSDKKPITFGPAPQTNDQPVFQPDVIHNPPPKPPSADDPGPVTKPAPEAGFSYRPYVIAAIVIAIVVAVIILIVKAQ